MRKSLWTPLIIVAAACSEIAPIELGICGNGILEPENSEDCDSVAVEGSACSRECRFICADTSCPAGWACGGDAICRRPSGTFFSSGVVSLPSPRSQLELADFDGDGALDLAAVDAGSIAVLYGPSFQGSLVERVRGLGRCAFGDLDGDGRPDGAVPQNGGISLLHGESDRTLSPIAAAQLDVETFRVPDGVTARLVPVFPPDAVQHELLLIMSGDAVPGPGTDTFTCVTFPKGECLPARSVIFRARVEDLISAINAPLATAAGEEILLAFRGARELRLIGFRGAGDLLEVLELSVMTLPSDATISGPAFVDDFNGDDFPDVVVVVNSAGTMTLAAALGSAAGLGGFFLEHRLDAALAAGEILLAAGDLDGDERADFVGGERIYLAGGKVISRPSRSALWSEAIVADFNRDSLPDLAAVSAGRPGVDFMLGTGTAVMNPTFIDTLSPPIFLRSGDFDGDLVQDLAAVERGAADQISVFFGNLQGPISDPINMGTLRSVVRSDVLYYRHPALDEDLISDLMVESEGTVHTLAFLLGASDRRLRSALGLTSDPPPPAPPVPRAVWMGSFSGTENTDLVAATNLGLWLVRGSGTTEIDPAGMSRLSAPAADAELGCAQDLALSCTESVVARLSGAASEVIAAVRTSRVDCEDYFRRERVALASPRMSLIRVDGGLVCASVELEDRGAVRRLVAGDLDGNSAAELFVVHESGVTVHWDMSVSGAAARVSFVSMAGVSDVAALNLDEDLELELAMVSAGGVRVGDLVGGEVVLRDGPVGGGERVLSGDLDGDGLGDLVVVDGERVEIWMAADER